VKEYAPENIRNVAIAGHQECGKTILSESLLFTAGAINRLGKIDDGNTTMDCTQDEIERKISIQSAVAFCEHKGAKINFVDTPGYEDFVGEVLCAMDVVESAIIPVRSDAGVEVGTDKVWGYVQDRGLSTLLVVTKLDKEHADFDHCVDQAVESFGGNVKIFQLPIGQGDNFTGIVDLVSNKAWEFSKDGKGTAKEIEIPADLRDRADTLRKELMETAAEADEAHMEKYLETETLDDDEFLSGLATGVASGEVYPVYCASSIFNIGAAAVLDGIVDLLPSPSVRIKKSGEEKEIKADTSGPPAAFVFKNTSDSHVGDMLFLRGYSGSLSGGSDIYNVTKDTGERLGQLYAVQGKNREEIPKLPAGDLGAVVKLKSTKIGDTLSSKGSGIQFAPTVLPSPSIFAAISSATKGDEDKMGTGLAKLHDEDPAFEVKVDPEIKQTLISGQGEMHLEVVVGRLKARFGVEVILDKPRIPYKETIKKTAEAQGKYKKQTGGRGQYGDVHIKLEPLPRGEGFEFVDAIVGGVVPGKFIPAVEKGLVATMADGVIAGYPFVDVRATLYDGSYHTVDSSEQAFKMAGSMAFKKCVESAVPTLLEPIINVQVKVPEEFMGDVMGDLSGRRGKIQGMEPRGKFNVINAQVPLAELYRYSTHLRSMTQGRGTHFREFSHYEEVPHDAMQKVIDEAKKEKEEDRK
jgi:elongation factor G